MAEDIRTAADGVLSHIVRVGGEGADGYEQWLNQASTLDAGNGPRPEGDGTALQLYTSGTTGLPKGVLLSEANVAMLKINDTGLGLDLPGAVSLVAMPLFHIGGSGWALAGMVRGATSVLTADIDPVRLLDTLEQQRVTHVFLVPAVLRMLSAVPGAADRDLSALRCVLYGASPITSAVLKRSMATLHAPHYQVYGLTETTAAVTQLDASDHDPGGPRAHLLRSAGRPYPWIELRIVDPSTGEAAAVGDVGEVWVRSTQVTPGYWQRPSETVAVLTGDCWFRTGDTGYLDDDGYLFLTDRITDMIVTGGENVYPIEVEDVLCHHPAVADVAVIGVPDDRWGETVKALVVRAAGTDDLTEQELMAFCRNRLAGFKRPTSVDFVHTLP
ncbi:MAG TPA: AMP-binding protein, partial [Frankiaceae bacterium]|nr:AMP-binding protein [Frankiaceae bacterium]